MNQDSPYKEVNKDIIERCRKGDNSAFHKLYKLYADAMFNVAVRILNNSEEAKEVLQDSFLKAFENLNKYNQNLSFGSWLKRIVINHSLNALKKRKIKFQPFEIENYAEKEEDSTTQEIIYSVETIRECVLRLPDGYRAVVSLFLFEGLSHKEIGGMLGISEGTSKSQYNRAKKKLIQLLKNSNTDVR
jgi:RNA polymerase sigma-70 factor (ECF subfamily)